MNEDRHSSGPFCRVEFVFNIRDGLRTFGSPDRVEPKGTQVHVIHGNFGEDTRYLPARHFKPLSDQP